MYFICYRTAEEKGVPVIEGKEKFIICRSDKTTKNRHIERNHKEIKVESHGSYTFIVEENDVEAQRLLSVIKEFKTSAKQLHSIANVCSSKSTSTIASVLDTFQELETTPKQSESFPSSFAQTRITQKYRHDVELQNDVVIVDSLEQTALQSLHMKIDSLSKAMEKISIKVQEKKSQSCELGPLLAVGQRNFEDALPVVHQWNNVENIGDILELFPMLRLFPSTCEDQIAVLRCDVCFRYLTKDPYSSLTKWKDALDTARKGVGRYE